MKQVSDGSEVAAADTLEALLAGAYVDRESGKPQRVRTRSLVIAETLKGREAELVEELGLGRRLAVLSDPQTHAVLGEQVERALGGRFIVESLRLPERPEPDSATVEKVRAATAGADALIAVGSGTINDLAKYAGALDGKPYAVFGTAPSMNGYTSLTASITVHGHKSTLPAQAPAGAFFDLGVLAAAPPRLIRAGLGDSICRTTAQWDWLLTHLLLDTSYSELPFDLLAEDEPALVEAAPALLDGDLAAMRSLVRTLVLSGFGTAIIGSSAPASQAEHLVSHYIDMFGPADRPPVFHGEQVGVTTLVVARLQERLLESLPLLTPDDGSAEAFSARYGAELGASIWDEFSHKRLSAAAAERLNARLARDWPAIRGRLETVMLGSARIEAALKAAGAPTTPEQIGLERGFFEQALRRCREIRNRYTVLDLASQSGQLESLIPML